MTKLGRKYWDLWFIIFGSILLIGVAYALPDSELTLLIGIPFLLFFPGYSAVNVLFPDWRLDIIERLALSVGISIAISPSLGIGLNLILSKFVLSTMLLVIGPVTLALTVMAVITRYRTEQAYEPMGPFQVLGQATIAHGDGRRNQVLSSILVVAIVLSGTGLVYMISNPPQGESYTEFYMLGPTGNTTAYPNKLTVGESTHVYLGIANHEHRQVTYKIEVWLCNMTISSNSTINSMFLFDSMNVTLSNVPVTLGGNWTKQWETEYDFRVLLSGHYRLFFLLYMDTEPAYPEPLMVPYRDYSATETYRIQSALNNSINSLNLVLDVSTATQ